MRAPAELLRRAPRALRRELRLGLVRATRRRVRMGAGCDLRSGLLLEVGTGASARFGPGCVLDRNMTVEVPTGALHVGARVVFGHTCTLGVKESVVIGDDCLIAELVSIRDHDHETGDLSRPIRQQGARCAPVVIEDGAWLGSRVVVLKGVRIGEGAIVGAGAVVTRDVPAYGIALGVPARVVGTRAPGSATCA